MDQEGLLFPKNGKGKKKRKKHRKSILHRKEDRTCFLCMEIDGNYNKHTYLEEHHLYLGNPDRDLSEEWGLKIYLCPMHHRDGYYAVHRNADVMEQLQARGQQAFEERYLEEEFTKIFMKNYKEGKTMYKIKEEDCTEIKSVGQYAVYVKQGCQNSHMIRGVRVTSKKQCEKCKKRKH